MNDINLRVSDQKRDATAISHPPLGRLLVDTGKISQTDLTHALGLQARIDAPLGDIMIAEGFISKGDLLGALAFQARTQGADLDAEPPALDMASRLPMALCLKHCVVPWRTEAQTLFVAAASPAGFARLRDDLGAEGVDLFPVIVDQAQIHLQQSRLYGVALAKIAETRVPISESCRSWGQQARARLLWGAGLFGLFLAALALAPLWTVTVFSLCAVVTLLMTSALKAAALCVHFRPRPKTPALPDRSFRLPRVSVMVPLLHEGDIAGQLIARLSHLTYPKSLLDVVLVLEEGDQMTRATITRTNLPSWMSVVEVPAAGGLTTKPRALNYALDFCKGSIIGVWDAEDWPEPDQIEKVADRFNSAPEHVVCLQGILDYYNSRSTWLSRCFTIEYAMWWRIIMPGIARLGLVVPLGGTTLFFKRGALEQLGGWDAHNVTEDADLGVRLARHGYKTELLSTVTREEATSRAWPWVRQRSRWLKGFLVTYFVHMRSPRKLLKEVGLWRFIGLQTIFLAAFSQFASAPLLWSFWLTLAGITHPVALTLGTPFIWSLAVLFTATEVLSFALGIVAVSHRDRRHLMPYVPTMMIYFGLGALASYKALWELVRTPFYWDKTQHGVSTQTDHLPKPSDIDAA